MELLLAFVVLAHQHWIPVAVAAVTVSGVIFTGWISLQIAKLNRAVGKPNGEGNVVEMQEKLLVRFGALEERLDEHMRDPHAHENLWDPPALGLVVSHRRGE